jgi:hypothetical protein
LADVFLGVIGSEIRSYLRLMGDMNFDRGSEEDRFVEVAIGGEVGKESRDDFSWKDQESGTTMKT